MTSCWVITEGLKGTENQCIALAEAAGLYPEIKRVKLRQPWKTVTPWVPGFSDKAFAKGSSEFSPPWPNIIIASGRKAIAPALWIKKQSGYRTKLVIVQSPVIKNKNFDLVIAPRHDRYHGPNVFEITGALSLITKDKLIAAGEEWEPILGSLPGPRLAVLIGGNSRTHKMTPAIMDQLTTQLIALRQQGYSLMITASRRTSEHFIKKMRDALFATPNAGLTTHFWDGSGANPYIGYLAWADAILTTEDSVSMPSEALSTGKPLYIIPMEGGSPRFKRFHDYLINNSYARWFQGQIEQWSYQPPEDLAFAAQKTAQISQN